MGILWKTLHTPCSAANPGAALLMCTECSHGGKEKAVDSHGGELEELWLGTRTLDSQFCDLTTKSTFSLFRRKAVAALHRAGRMGL